MPSQSNETFGEAKLFQSSLLLRGFKVCAASSSEWVVSSGLFLPLLFKVFKWNLV